MSGSESGYSTASGRKEAERKVESVRQQGGIFVEAVRATRMAMLVTDATLPGNPVIFANGAFLALSGYSMDEVLGQEPHFLDGPQTDPATVRQFDIAIKERRDEALEVLQYRKDGSTFWAALFVAPQADEQGHIVHHFLSFLDITRRREAEEELRRLNAELDRRVSERTLELTAANARLSRLVQQNEMLLHEVNHRAKNSLALVSALLLLQGKQQADPAVKASFQQAQARLSAMARAHDLLSRSEEGQRVALAGYPKDLCASLVTADGTRIRAIVDADESIQVPAERAIPIGLIVNELVTNAVKHAFPSLMTGTIEVQAHRSSPDRVSLLIRDDGVGMQANARQGSLGYGIIQSLASKIGGEINISRDIGVAVTLSFPG